MPLSVYLAGPDVFLADALEVGRRKKALCEDFGFRGLFPLDNEDEKGADAAKIFRANCALMARADVGVLNLTPFRSVSADPGTVFELGFLFARGRPVFGYTSTAGTYSERVSSVGVVERRDGRLRDIRGHAVEDFGLADNLMIVRSIEESGGALSVVDEGAGADAGASLAAFRAFRSCLETVKQRLG